MAVSRVTGTVALPRVPGPASEFVTGLLAKSGAIAAYEAQQAALRAPLTSPRSISSAHAAANGARASVYAGKGY